MGLSAKPNAQHDLDGYRRATMVLLYTLDCKVHDYSVAGTPMQIAVSLAGLWRSARLLQESLLLLDSDSSSEGAGMLCRGAYEAAIVSLWLIGDPARLDLLLGDLLRQQRFIAATFDPGRFKQAYEAYLDFFPPSVKVASTERMVSDVADWLGTVEPTFLHRLEPDGSTTPIVHDGEPFRSSYTHFFRSVSTYAVHGAAPIKRLLAEPPSELVLRADAPPVGFGDLQAVFVAAGLVSVAATHVFEALGEQRYDLGPNNERIEWVAATMRMNVVTNAIVDDDPSYWYELGYGDWSGGDT